MASESEVNYFIKITDHINKSDRIISKQTTLASYMDDFKIIMDELSKNDTYTSTISNGKVELFKNVEIEVKGYIFNTKTTVTKLAIELNLIKIEENLSKIFNLEKEVQTEILQESQEAQEQKEQKEQNSQTEEEHTSKDIYQQTTFYDDEFSDFQGYEDPEVFSEVSLNSPKIYQKYEYPQYPCQLYQPYTHQSYTYQYPNFYEQNVIVPTYTQPTYTSTTYNQVNENNPFNNIMNLRDENTDSVHFSFSGSQVPETPTRVSSSTWSPELINELKFRLAQPNAGLTNSNSNYFL